MSRHTKNWIDSYIELQSNTEPAAIFDRWVAYSVVAAALRRKVHLQLGRLTYYPNLYIVLVAGPGVARKTQSIKYGTNFLDSIPEIRTCADSATKEAMTDDIEGSAMDTMLDNGENIRHSSLNIISKEFESFLGQKKENTRMLTALTDLFDCPSEWSSRTRHGTSNAIVGPWINLLAATTPDSLASSLPASAIGGGLTSRILFVWAEKKKKAIAIPEMTEKEKKLKKKLEDDLYQISSISGEYKMSPECKRNWVDWYTNYDEDESGERICEDKSFSGWYSRKPTYLMKLSMIRAAAASQSLIIQWHHVEEAIEAIQQVEFVMGNAFKAIGKSEITAEVDTVMQIIRTKRRVSEKELMSIIWRDIDSTKFENVIGTLMKTGKVVREYKGPDDERGIWYRWTGDLEKENK
ncbi:MAG: DUF3987 domain-containing protein [Desulfobacterales bacterium]|nr:DUF3987 domain-containing protein [Desulfobacterales bacterium]